VQYIHFTLRPGMTLEGGAGKLWTFPHEAPSQQMEGRETSEVRIVKIEHRDPASRLS